MRKCVHFEIGKQGDVYLARLVNDKLVGDLITEAAEELYWVAAQADCLKLLIKLSGIPRLSTEMFGKLIVVNKRMEQKGGRLKICEACPWVREVFAITKLDQILDIRDTEDEALAAFG